VSFDDLFSTSPKLTYTVGYSRQEDGYYIALPWRLRGTWPELAAESENHSQRLIGLGCVGIEFRDNHVQIQRYRWPWLDRSPAAPDTN